MKSIKEGMSMMEGYPVGSDALLAVQAVCNFRKTDLI
jgi:hypothetical protein